MNNNDLRKLNRKDLLEIVLEQTKRIEELENKIDKLNEELDLKKISIKESGSIAEASLKISSIFKSVDEAAEIYMNNIKELARKEEKRLRKEAKDAKNKIILETEKRCKRKEELLEKKLKELEVNEFKINKNNKKNKKIKEKANE